jgi:hypothetical protein
MEWLMTWLEAIKWCEKKGASLGFTVRGTVFVRVWRGGNAYWTEYGPTMQLPNIIAGIRENLAKLGDDPDAPAEERPGEIPLQNDESWTFQKSARI